MTISRALLLAQAWDDHHDFDGGWIVMMVGMLLFWGLLIVGIVLLVRHFTGPGAGSPLPASPPREDSALEILDRRFALGEISTEEYRDRRAVLRGERPGRG